MFKKKPVELPPGTFLPTPKRVLAIIQLCLALSLFLWYAAQPFVGEYFFLRSNMLPYEYIMGTSELLKKKGEAETLLLKSNRERFEALSSSQKELILKDYHLLRNKANRSTLTKLKEGLYSLLFLTPPFELAWIFFSAALAILLLLKVEGAQQAVWLLPFITIFYSIDHYKEASPSSNSEERLFPTEQTLIQDYLKHPLSSSFSEQQQQLQMAWDHYLIQNWSHETPSTEPIKYKEQVEKGTFLFTLARLEEKHHHLFKQNINSSTPTPFILFIFYMSWNFFFAWKMSRKDFTYEYMRTSY